MAREIVEDHHVPRFQGREQLGFDIGIEKRPVDCAVDYSGRCQSVLAQTGDESLGMPMPERRMIDKPLANRRPAGGFDHLGVEGGLIDEDQAVQGLAHEGLAAGDPDATRQRHVRPVLLGGEQCFFYG